ncbi:MAG: helix-turn-helix domain-containing protein [Nocardioidaceae bacterium]
MGEPREMADLLAELERTLDELERIHQVMAAQTAALAMSAKAASAKPRSVYSIREAAAELGISVSMLHKLMNQHRLGYLKVGSRTLITTEHLAQFRSSSQVAAS